MSITTQYSLWSMWPAYHKGLWVFNSDNKTQTGFTYIIDVYSGGSNTFIDRFTSPPRPGDGYGLWNASVLRSKIDQSKDVREGSVGWKAAPNSQCWYYLKIGEKVDYWQYSNFYFYAGSVGFTSYTNTAHSFEVGDQILISQFPPFLNNSYEGFATVTVVPDPYTIVINKSFDQSSDVTGGIIRNADGTPVIVSGLTTTRNSYVIGSSMNRFELEAYDEDDWQSGISGGAGYLMTDTPSRFTMRENGRMILSVPQFSGKVTGGRFITYDENNVEVGQYALSMTSPLVTTPRMLYFACGPYDVVNGGPTVISGPSSFLFSTVSRYDMYLYNSASTAISETLRIDLDRECEDIEYNILFMDKKGTFNTFSFCENDDIEFENKKKTYNYDGVGIYGAFGSGGFSNNTDARGYTIFDSRQIKNMTVRSKPMTEDMSEYMMQMHSSPITYLMVSPEVWLPIIINDVTAVQKKYENDEFIQYELKFSMAYNENINW